ncbi:uncharacterized protein LOC121836123 [Ixodes scapularis]|uniref:uncharacterized protein LOC121836123 n=1 Tax=Ixodes scapularis TaxID=6945 RepID=UPI001C38B9D4|nr:uncharacterized protein LOC121836123 [Ixodes scapularis]
MVVKTGSGTARGAINKNGKTDGQILNKETGKIIGHEAGNHTSNKRGKTIGKITIHKTCENTGKKTYETGKMNGSEISNTTTKIIDSMKAIKTGSNKDNKHGRRTGHANGNKPINEMSNNPGNKTGNRTDIQIGKYLIRTRKIANRRDNMRST